MDEKQIIANLRQCERDLMKLDSNAPALDPIREAIQKLEARPERRRSEIFTREFWPR